MGAADHHRTLLDICEADWDDKTDADYQEALIKSDIIQQAVQQRSNALNSFTLERIRNTITAATGIASDTISKKKIVTEEQEEWANRWREHPGTKGKPGIQNLDLPFARAGSRDDDEEHDGDDNEMAAPVEANSPVAGKVDKSVKDKHCPTYRYSAKDIKSSTAGDITLGAIRDAHHFQASHSMQHPSFKHRPRLMTVQVPANTAVRRLTIKVDPEPSVLDRDGDVEMAGEPGGAANDKHRGDGPDQFNQHGAINYVDRGLKTALDATLVQRQFEFHAFFVPAIKRALDAARQISPFHPVKPEDQRGRVEQVQWGHPGLAGLDADRQDRLEVEFNETWERMSDLEKAAFARNDLPALLFDISYDILISQGVQIAHMMLGSYGHALEELHTLFTTATCHNTPVEIAHLGCQISARPLENTQSFVCDVGGPRGLLLKPSTDPDGEVQERLDWLSSADLQAARKWQILLHSIKETLFQLPLAGDIASGSRWFQTGVDRAAEAIARQGDHYPRKKSGSSKGQTSAGNFASQMDCLLRETAGKIMFSIADVGWVVQEQASKGAKSKEGHHSKSAPVPGREHLHRKASKAAEHDRVPLPAGADLRSWAQGGLIKDGLEPMDLTLVLLVWQWAANDDIPLA
ncbi:hypothetical protein JCM5296_005711, partial [Sporobolomyces johnsonii]